MAKAHLFDSEVKKDDRLSQQKIVMILVKIARRVEMALEEIRKLLAGTRKAEPSQPFAPPTMFVSPWKKIQHVLEVLRERLEEMWEHVSLFSRIITGK